MKKFLNDLVQKHDLYDADVIVLRNGKIVAQEFITQKDVPIYYQPEQLVRVASISKLFVSVAIMQLVEKGQVSLSSPVSAFLKFSVMNPHYPSIPITIEMLLTHTSSLQDTNQLYIPFGKSMKELFEVGGLYYHDDLFVSNNGKNVKPGERFVYYNAGFQLLACVIESVSNQRFDQYINQSILKPLGMKGSFHLHDEGVLELVRPTYRKTADKWVPQFDEIIPQKQDYSNYELGTNGSLFSPQGGLRSNALELSKFMKWICDPSQSILQPKTLHEMMKIHFMIDNPTDYSPDDFLRNSGLGFNVLTPTSYNHPCREITNTFVGHLGLAYGFHGLFFVDPQSKNGIIFLVGGHGKPLEEYQGENSSYFSFQEEVLRYVNKEYWRNV